MDKVTEAAIFEAALAKLQHMGGGNASVYRVRVESAGQSYIVTMVVEHADLRPDVPV